MYRSAAMCRKRINSIADIDSKKLFAKTFFFLLNSSFFFHNLVTNRYYLKSNYLLLKLCSYIHHLSLSSNYTSFVLVRRPLTKQLLVGHNVCRVSTSTCKTIPVTQ